jgi:tungstate transport system substrate-binding protein
MHQSLISPRLRQAAGILLALMLVLSVVGCSSASAPKPAATTQTSDVVVASTTSTQDSGLFDVLIPAFEAAYPQYKAKVVAVGSGEAIKLGETKDADVLLVHSPAAEKKFLAAGFATERNDVMYNDFVIVGPPADPAGVKGSTSAAEAMKKIAEAGKAGKATFVGRGDASGTDAKEKTLWTAANVATPTPAANPWYISTGQGMGETLKVADEKGAYTIADRATWLSMKDQLPGLTILYEGDKALFNQYGVIVIPDSKNEAGGQAFADYVLSPEGQKVIAEFGIEKYGQALFTPNATK